MQAEQLVSLGAYFALMLGIGVYAYRRSTQDSAGYLLGGRSLGPAVGALSAGASDMSGWMLLGLPGAVYASGLSSAWIAVGLTVGAYLNYRFVAPRLRVYTEVADDAITIPDYFEKRFGAGDGGGGASALRVIAGLVIVVFFTVYTSSGVVAGGKLFDAAFGLDYRAGLLVTAGVVVAYTLFGGFLAVSLTDFVQGCIMFAALVLVPIAAVLAIGGPGEAADALRVRDPALLSATRAATPSGPSVLSLGALVSLLAWGLGYFGQPHIIVRFMAIRSLADIAVARRIGMTWMTVTVIGAVGVGLSGAAWVATNPQAADAYLGGRGGLAAFDPETIFIVLSQVLFHPLAAGFLLAAILAAIMSTISSQLLVSSASLTEDFFKAFIGRDASERTLVAVGRACVLIVAIVAVVLALDPQSNVLGLVANAWFGFGSAFGPLVLLSLYWRRMTRAGALAAMLTGAGVVLVWIYSPLTIGGLPAREVIAAIIPGFGASLAAGVGVSLLGRVPARVTARHLEMEDTMAA